MCAATSIHLAERADPDEGKNKHARVLEGDGTGPIAATPLCAIGSCGAGGLSCGREKVAERPAKRAVRGTPKQVECSPSSGRGAGTASTEGGTSKEKECAPTGASDAAGSFVIASLPSEGSSGDSTPSRVYAEDGDDAGEAPYPTGAPGMYRTLRCLKATCWIIYVFVMELQATG